LCQSLHCHHIDFNPTTTSAITLQLIVQKVDKPFALICEGFVYFLFISFFQIGFFLLTSLYSLISFFNASWKWSVPFSANSVLYLFLFAFALICVESINKDEWSIKLFLIAISNIFSNICLRQVHRQNLNLLSHRLYVIIDYYGLSQR